MSHRRDPQLQLGEKYSDLTNSTILKSYWLVSRFIFNTFKKVQSLASYESWRNYSFQSCCVNGKDSFKLVNHVCELDDVLVIDGKSHLVNSPDPLKADHTHSNNDKPTLLYLFSPSFLLLICIVLFLHVTCVLGPYSRTSFEISEASDWSRWPSRPIRSLRYIVTYARIRPGGIVIWLWSISRGGTMLAERTSKPGTQSGSFMGARALSARDSQNTDNNRISTDNGLMLGERCRRWPNIRSATVQRLFLRKSFYIQSYMIPLCDRGATLKRCISVVFLGEITFEEMQKWLR